MRRRRILGPRAGIALCCSRTVEGQNETQSLVFRGLASGWWPAGCGDNCGAQHHLGPPPNQQTGVGGAGSTRGGTGGGAGGDGRRRRRAAARGRPARRGPAARRDGRRGGRARANPLACADIFDQGSLADLRLRHQRRPVASAGGRVPQPHGARRPGLDFATYHPITFHLNGETVTDAAIKLHGQSSWAQTVMFDGDRAKMQFDVSFDQIDPDGRRSTASASWCSTCRATTGPSCTIASRRPGCARSGILAPCSASARLDINGTYYGLYVLEQGVGNGTVQRVLPEQRGRRSLEGGRPARDQHRPATRRASRRSSAAEDLTSLAAIMDIPGSINSWAAEALINDSDGYYSGSHNFCLYDQGAAGFVFLPQDTDSTFDWLATFDLPGAQDHPIYWWVEPRQAGADPGRQVAASSSATPAWREEVRRRHREPARQVGRGADPGLDRHLVAADRRRRHQRSARLGHRRRRSRRPPRRRATSCPARRLSADLRRLRARRGRRRHRRGRRRLPLVRRVRRQQRRRAPGRGGDLRQRHRRQLQRLRRRGLLRR